MTYNLGRTDLRIALFGENMERADLLIKYEALPDKVKKILLRPGDQR